MTYTSSMKLNAYKINGDKLLETVPAGTLSPTWYEDSTHRWLDVEGADSIALNKLLEPLNLHPQVLEACVKPSEGSQFVAYENEMFVNFPVLWLEKDNQQTHVSIICLPTTLLTIHHQAIPGLPKLVDNLSTKSWLQEGTASALLCELLSHVTEKLTLWATPLRARLSEISYALNENPESVEVNDILELKRYTEELIDVLEDLQLCLTRLKTVESEFFQSDRMSDYLRNLTNTIQTGRNVAQRYEGRLYNLYQHYAMTRQENMNRHLSRLTIISAIFLPLTLLTGIYGMNFEHMPALGLPYGYLAVLGSMVVIVVVMLFVFNRRGWFK